jgi:hypothetical protein
VFGTFPVSIVRAIAILLYRRCDLCKKDRAVTTPFCDALGFFAHKECLEKGLVYVHGNKLKTSAHAPSLLHTLVS